MSVRAKYALGTMLVGLLVLRPLLGGGGHPRAESFGTGPRSELHAGEQGAFPRESRHALKQGADLPHCTKPGVHPDSPLLEELLRGDQDFVRLPAAFRQPLALLCLYVRYWPRDPPSA